MGMLDGLHAQARPLQPVSASAAEIGESENAFPFEGVAVGS
jgi:hypothetical protein